MIPIGHARLALRWLLLRRPWQRMPAGAIPMLPTTRLELVNRRLHQPRWAFLSLLFRRCRFINRRLLPLSALAQQAHRKRWRLARQAAVAGQYRLAHFAVRQSPVRPPPAFTMPYPTYSPPLRSNFSPPHPLAAQWFTERASAICLQLLPTRFAPDWRLLSNPASLWARDRIRSSCGCAIGFHHNRLTNIALNLSCAADNFAVVPCDPGGETAPSGILLMFARQALSTSNCPSGTSGRNVQRYRSNSPNAATCAA
jgi:hypothetical protein